ncbi:hypothetical protein, partial [Streptomyces sp. GbtcB7]|uniref:hypothetical protein n=1 Tax=Streptomyces sp. GbtcB7 TaxID=2824752 RepID=UPI001C2F90A6
GVAAVEYPPVMRFVEKQQQPRVFYRSRSYDEMVGVDHERRTCLTAAQGRIQTLRQPVCGEIANGRIHPHVDKRVA